MKKRHLWSCIVLLCFLFLAGGSADTDDEYKDETDYETCMRLSPNHPFCREFR